MRREASGRYERNNIVFVCQECGGDLKPKPEAGSARCRYECHTCKLVFTYGSAGWERIRERVMESTAVELDG